MPWRSNTATTALASTSHSRPGQVDWDEPTDRIHRAVNSSDQPYEEITVFFLDRPDAVPQPKEA